MPELHNREEDQDLNKGGNSPAPNDDGQSSKEKDDEDKDKSGDDKSKSEETVSISKSELEKLRVDNENYRKGFLSLKQKGMSLPQDKKQKGKGDDEGDEPEYVTKEEMRANNEQQAIGIAANDSSMPGLVENWSGVMAEFKTSVNRDKVANVLDGIRDAYGKWAEKNPKKVEAMKSAAPAEDTHKKAAADLAADKGVDKGKDKTPKGEKKGGGSRQIIPKKEGIDSWYGDGDKKE